MPDDTTAPVTAEGIARLFHDTYERLAPEHGYETRKASAVRWEDVPAANKSLMTAVAGHVLAALAGDSGDLPARMAEAILRARFGDEEPPASQRQDAARDAAAAMGVRDDHLVYMTARAVYAEGQLSARRDHETRWELEKARADKAEAGRDRYRIAWRSARERAQCAGETIMRCVHDRDLWKGTAKAAQAEVERLREQLRLTDIDAQNTEAERADAEDERKRLDAEVERLQAELAAPETPERRCPSCDHLTSIHQPDGCWYTVTTGAKESNLVCPCSVPAAPETPGDAEEATDER
jgi:hypothetical protein